MQFNDLTGNKYEKLTVLSLNKIENNVTLYNCMCSCGAILIVGAGNLTNGHTKSCGCLRKKNIKDITGKRFGWLMVVEKTINPNPKRREAFWKCLCDCGNEVSVNGYNLRSGQTKSCGCYNIYIKTIRCKNGCIQTKHGLSRTRGYKNNINQKRKIAQRNQTPRLSDKEIKKVQLIYKISEELGSNWQVDHIQPISKGGLHHPDNLQIVTKEYNMEKKDNENFRKPNFSEFYDLEKVKGVASSIMPNLK